MDSISDAVIPRSNARQMLKDNYLTKISRSTAPTLDIYGIRFGIMNPQEMLKLAAEKITDASVNSKGAPLPKTLNAATMGPQDRSSKCEICQLTPCDCDGQFGAFDLPYPFVNVLFYENLFKILKCVCFWCSRILLNKSTSEFHFVISAEKDPAERLNLCVAASERIRYCDPNPPKRVNRKKKSDSSTSSSCSLITTVTDQPSEQDKQARRERLLACGCCGGVQFQYRRHVNDVWRRAKASDDDGEFIQGKNYFTSQADVLRVLSGISDEDLLLLGCDPRYSRPEHMLWTVVPVPPAHLRPVVNFKSGSRNKSENPFTKKEQDIKKMAIILTGLRIKLIRNSKALLSQNDNGVPQPSTTTSIALTETDISRKTKSTLTAVFRQNKAQQKAKEKKDKVQLHLALEDNALVMSTTNKSGCADIPDEEWEDYLTYDCAKHDSTRWAVVQLQYLIGNYLKDNTPMPPMDKKHPLRVHGSNKCSIYARFKGKGGIVRGVAMAKRNDFSVRGVLTPNAWLDNDELNIPESRATELTTPEVVTEMNFDLMRRLVINGPTNYPGANLVNISTEECPTDDNVDLRYIDRYEFAEKWLEIGMVVHRHLILGEIVVFNRQPSLHKFSIMGHRIRITSGSTFEMPPDVCVAYNMDFDGDAGVIHIIQTYGARTECHRILRVELQMVTPQSSTPIIKPIQDTVTGLFQLTQNDILIPEQDFLHYAGQSIYIPVERLASTMPAMICRAAHQFKAYRTGKQLFSQCLPENTFYASTSEFSSRFYYAQPILEDCTVVENVNEYVMSKCFRDSSSSLMISNSQLLSGVLTASILVKLIHAIIQKFGNACALRFQSSITRVNASWFSNFGFSMSPHDCIVPDQKSVLRLIDDGLAAIQAHPLLKIGDAAAVAADDAEDGNEVDEKRPPHFLMNKARMEGMESLERQRERTVISMINQFVALVGDQVQKQVEIWNRVDQMIQGGGKGTEHNVTQMLGMVGQTEINKQRIPCDMRVTAHHVRTDMQIAQRWLKYIERDPLLKQGLVKRCFALGLTAYEFYMHAMLGRVGMIASVMLTGETGYTYRRLCAAMSDLCIYYDLSVRDAAGNVLQILYGGDGWDAAFLVKFELPLVHMDDMQMYREFALSAAESQEVWHLETQIRDESLFRQLLVAEFAGLQALRHKVRASRLHFDCMKLDSNVTLPVNPFLLLIEAKSRVTTDREPANVSHLIYFVHRTVEHLYRYYSRFYNRLWDLEAAIYSALSIRNVLIRYQLTVSQVNWILGEIVMRFSKALVDAKEGVGPLAAQMLGQLYTQNALNSHSGPGAKGTNVNPEEGTITIIQELTSLTENPKAPFMRVYPLPVPQLKQLLSAEAWSELINRSSQDAAKPVEYHVAEFVQSQLVHRTLADFLITTPRVVLGPDEESVADAAWLDYRLQLCTPTEHKQIAARSPCVIRLMVDAQKCSRLGLTPHKIVIAIRQALNDDVVPENASQLQKKVNAAIFGLPADSPPVDFSIAYDTEMLAFCSPTLADFTNHQEGWVIRLHVSPQSKYYVNFLEGSPLDEKNAVSMLMHHICRTTRLCGIPGIQSARIESEMRQVENPETGSVEPQSEYVVITRGTAMLQTLALPFVDNKRSMTSHLVEINKVWGIEVGATCLGRSLQKVLQARNGNVDKRHLMMLVKTMCHRGFLMPFRRDGINKLHDMNTFSKMAFEEPLDVAVQAATHGKFELINDNASASIIGKPVPTGTGGVNTFLFDSAPDAETMKSHADFLNSRVIPVYNSLDSRVMLYNSGEDQIYHSNDRYESKEFGTLRDAIKQQKYDAEEVERLMHYDTRKVLRCSTLKCMKNYVKDDQQVYAPTIALADQKAPIAVKTVSSYWTQIKDKRDQAREDMRERIALKQCATDHAAAISTRKRKAANAVFNTGKKSSALAPVRYKLPQSFESLLTSISSTQHTGGEAFVSHRFAVNASKLLPKCFL